MIVVMTPRDWPTKKEFAKRDKAIRSAAAAGANWADQALAGLSAFSPGTRGLAERFAYILTCAQSPLKMEGLKTNAWGGLIASALRRGVLERTGHFYRTQREGNIRSEYVTTGKAPSLLSAGRNRK